MRKVLFFIILITTIFFTGCNPIEIINLERGALHFTLPAAKRSLPIRDNVVLYKIIITSTEHVFEQEKEGFPGQEVIFDNLLPGNYNATVLAFDEADTLIFQGSAEGIEVIPGIIKQVVIQLNYVTGGIEISIIFPDSTPIPTVIPTPTPTLKPLETPEEILELIIAVILSVDDKRVEIEPVIIDQYSMYFKVFGDISGNCIVYVENVVNMIYDFNSYNNNGIILNTPEGQEINIIIDIANNKVNITGSIDIIRGSENHHIIFNMSYPLDGVSEIEGTIEVDGVVYPAKDIAPLITN